MRGPCGVPLTTIEKRAFVMGIGVREGIILLFLSTVLPAEVSIVIVVLLRIWSVSLDVIYWALSSLMVRLTKT